MHDFKAQHDLTRALERGLRITPSRVVRGGGHIIRGGGGGHIMPLLSMSALMKAAATNYGEYLGPL